MKIDARRWSWGVALATVASMGASGAWAQQTVAKLKQVNGNVLVSGQTGLATGSEAQPLANGVRIITTANSTVTVVFDNGCEVTLKENQRLDVESDKPCAALIAQAIGPAPAAGPGLAALVVPALIGGASVNAISSGTGGGGNTPSVSPN